MEIEQGGRLDALVKRVMKSQFIRFFKDIDYRVLDDPSTRAVEGSFVYSSNIEEDHDNALPSKWRGCDDVEIENANL